MVQSPRSETLLTRPCSSTPTTPRCAAARARQADWSMSAHLAQTIPGLMLAGGLNAANVAAAVRQVRPFAVDVASGVEASPGRKDHALVRAFIQQAKDA